MVTLRQDSRGNYFSRKRLPDDVREEYGRRHNARYEAKFFARTSLGKQIAQERFHLWATEVDQRIEAIRKAQRGEGMDLDREQAVALASDWTLWPLNCCRLSEVATWAAAGDAAKSSAEINKTFANCAILSGRSQ